MDEFIINEPEEDLVVCRTDGGLMIGVNSYEVEFGVRSFDCSSSIVLDADQTRALFRYLAGVVLPKVERIEDSYGVEFSAEDCSVVLPKDDWEEDSYRRSLALVACLLAAADEAKGVAS